MILYTDTETTSITPGKICQLSYVMQDKKATTTKNFFFSVDYVDPGALAVHGFSVDKLLALSGGKRFYDYAEEVYSDFAAADVIVGHNVSFDVGFLRAELERCGLGFDFGNLFCTMKTMTPVCKLKRNSSPGYKYPKLSELCSFFSLTDTEIKGDVKRLFGADVGFHDARFDTVALYLIANRGMETDCPISELKKYL